jgi:hypothetical protein
MVNRIKEILIGARNLIANAPDIARCSFEDKGCFCTHGAIIKTMHPNVQMFDRNQDLTTLNYGDKMNDESDEALKAIMAVIGVVEVEDVYDANYSATKEDVLAWFNTAIANQGE